MNRRYTRRLTAFSLFPVVLLAAALASAQSPKKVFVITDMEGVDGIFDSELQCIPQQSPRWAESQKLLTEEVNAAVDGLAAGGAADIVVWDGHDSGRTLSVLDINPKARLFLGRPVPPTLGLDSSYNAVIFIGQHSRAGTEKGILSHSYDSEGIQNMWINSQPVGEIGGRVMLAGYFGVPVIMLSGDVAACKELREMVPNAECAAVKEGVSRTAGYMLPHAAACKLIFQKARDAMTHVADFKPYRMTGPVELKVEFTTRSAATFLPRDGVEQIDPRTWAFKGKDLTDAWLKYGSF